MKLSAAKTVEFRKRLAEGTTLADLAPEGFAVVREAARRTLKMRHFDVQLIGGLTLQRRPHRRDAHRRRQDADVDAGRVPQRAHGRRRARRHGQRIPRAARRGLDGSDLPLPRASPSASSRTSRIPNEKRAAYRCDITYGTNNEFGFDYLRDNLAFSLDDRVQRGLAFAIVDEVDSILIDEARTPLIISGPAEENEDLYVKVNTLVPRLKKQLEEEGPGDFSVDEKQKQTHLTEAGHETVEGLMAEAGLLREGESLYDPQNIRLMHHLNAALRAHAIYKRDVEYIVRNGEVIIVDEFTGRTMPGRRWSDGLHQAVEAKEGVKVRAENQTVASITFQNYFRLYKKLSGMTGTADTEAPEFMQIYGLEVVVIPTHRPMIRKDNADFVYLTQGDKFKAIIEDIEDCVTREQPVLVGTTSIETSELLSGVLKENGIRARSAERQAARARGAHRRERRHAGQSDHRHEHGRSRHRHQTRRQQRSRARAGRRRRGRSGARRSHRRAHPRRLAGAPRQGGRRRRPAHHRHRTPRVAPHRQPAARPFGPPGRSGFEPLLSVDGRQPHAHLRRSESHEAAGWPWPA